jgi:mono/diheme cytochrome c family protein
MKKQAALITSGLIVIFLAATGVLFSAPRLPGPIALDPDPTAGLKTGREVYLAACANCHGADGRGVSQSQVGFTLPIRDFTDCQTTVREADPDWLAVVSMGGPARGFSELMPAFDIALSPKQIEMVVAYLRSFCPDRSWSRGELNLPRALATEKAFPEDEGLLTGAVNAKGQGLITNSFIYEQRLGIKNQIEVIFPFGWQKATAADRSSDWSSNLGDVAVGFKRVFAHSYEHGSIFSGGAEVIMPTGDEARGFGSGTFIFEPFILFGQILPADFFLQAHAGAELPFQTEKAASEAYLRLALGRRFDTGRWGRSWTPMVELVGVRELESGAKIDLDVIPQVQVTLNKRKNIRACLGLRLPVNHTAGRSSQVLLYLLWDWFDGTLFEGW